MNRGRNGTPLSPLMKGKCLLMQAYCYNQIVVSSFCVDNMSHYTEEGCDQAICEPTNPTIQVLTANRQLEFPDSFNWTQTEGPLKLRMLANRGWLSDSPLRCHRQTVLSSPPSSNLQPFPHPEKQKNNPAAEGRQ